jgi:DNA-binding response OmpR family regulator
MHATRTPHLRPAPEPDPQLAPRVLITIEDPLARRAVEGALRTQGFSVRATTDQAAAEVLLRSYEPEILVVDPHHLIPSLSPLLQRARRNEELYLVVHGADDTTRVGALRNGADEALAGDCTADEIAVRCEVLLRRPKRRRPRWDPLGSNEVRLGPLSVDLGRREIQVHGHVVAATRLEFDLFAQLCRHPQEVRSRAQLLEAVWGPGWVGDTHVVDVHLSNLRRKLRQRATDLQFVFTVRGVGFRLSDDLLRLALPEMGNGGTVHSMMA